MSFRDKYTNEEWNAIPPFTGFNHNKNIDEISKAIKLGLDKLPSIIKYSKKTPEAYDGIQPNHNPHYLDEMVTLGLTNKQFKSVWNATKPTLNKPPYDAPPKTLTHDDEVNRFGKVNLWDFSGGMNRDTDLTQIESGNYKFADNISVEEMMVERIKKENLPRDVIHNIVDKIHERKLSGKECAVAIMSYSDYDAIQSMHDFKIDSVWISGCLLKIHSSINLKDGEIEIY